MLLVTFYQFGKRENSTKQPTETQSDIFTTYQCLLKDDTNILHPRLILRVDGLLPWNPHNWTYAYIPDFSRYYFVENWEYVKPNWECILTIDPMASHKSSIGGESKYVLRAASDFDPLVIDTAYSPTADITTAYQTYQVPARNWLPDNGLFIIGVVGSTTNAINGVTYFELTQSELRSLLTYMYANVLNMSWDSLESWNAVLSKAFVGPSEYITSAFWYPFTSYINYGNQDYIKFGFWNTSVYAYTLRGYTVVNTRYNFTNPPNPYYTQGAWENLPPFASYKLLINPFGLMQLNAASCRSSGGVSVSEKIELTTGQGLLYVGDFDLSTFSTPPKVYLQRSAQYGVPIPIGAATQQSILNSVPEIITLAGMQDMPVKQLATDSGAGAMLANASLQVINNMLTSHTSSSGNVGSALGNSLDWQYMVTYAKPQNLNNDEIGAPLCQNRVLATLSGYILCADGEIEAPMYDEERKAIARYLTTGFYME